MSTLQAIPTPHGIEVLTSDLKNTVTQFQLVGAQAHNVPSHSLTAFYESTIEKSYYDENGVLTFILNLPVEQHFDYYLHRIHILDGNNQSVIECSTPPIALPKGIGGLMTLKASISGTAGEIIFNHSEFVTPSELEAAMDPLTERLDNLKLGFSAGQTWKTPSRQLNITYTNSNNYPIQVIASVYHQPIVNLSNDNTNRTAFLIVDNERVSWHTSTLANTAKANEIFSAIIPPGSTYKVEVPSSDWRKSTWAELS